MKLYKLKRRINFFIPIGTILKIDGNKVLVYKLNGKYIYENTIEEIKKGEAADILAYMYEIKDDKYFFEKLPIKN